MIFKKEGLVLPGEIVQCPIVECVCEVRFEPQIPSDAVFGAAYPQLKPLMGTALRLPILNLPPELRETDANLRYQPHYRFNKERYAVQLGPRVLSVLASAPYPGWPRFHGMVKGAIEALKLAGVADKVIRFGLRYISFIDGDVFDKIDVELRVNSKSVSARETSVSMVFDHRHTHLVRIRKDVTVKSEADKRTRVGSAIDIDTFSNNPSGGLDAMEAFLQEAHTDEKTIFFGMLKSEYLRTLGPKP